VAAGPNVIGGGQLARHNRVNRRASVEVTRQCRREGFRALKYRFASRCHGRQSSTKSRTVGMKLPPCFVLGMAEQVART